MGQQHDFYLVQSGNLVPRAALWRGFLACFQQPSLLRPANLDSSDLKHRITNAVSESLNSRIQWVKATARGFRNQQNFINAIYFHYGGLDMAPGH